MTRESFREYLIAAGAIRPAGHGRRVVRALRIDDASIRAACSTILEHEDARAVVEDQSVDVRIRACLARALEKRAAA